MPPKGFGTAVIGNTIEDEFLNSDTMAGFTSTDNQKLKYDIYKEPYKVKARNEANLWDIRNFTSVDNKMPIYPRRKGYVDFDGMSKRPPLVNINTTQEPRFASISY